MSAPAYEGSCHCGRIAWTVRAEPKHLTDCNCSICRRIGGLWAHVPAASVETRYAPDDAVRYVQGDRSLAMISCVNCGNTTHWESEDPAYEGMSVNMRMVEADKVAHLRVRKFDGADSWEFLD